jgi:hypothetical protein
MIPEDADHNTENADPDIITEDADHDTEDTDHDINTEVPATVYLQRMLTTVFSSSDLPMVFSAWQM